MHALSFILLLREIYGNKPPDLDRIQKRGLLAVKIAQHFALRYDFLREDTCHHLARLFRSTDSLPPDDVDTLLSQYVDDDWFEQVKEFNREPFASASIGQVHEATLKDGADVVVKLVKQDFSKRFQHDVASLRRLLRFAVTVYPKLRKVFDPMGVLDYIEDYTRTELDLTNEISGAGELAGILKKYGGTYDLSQLRLPTFFPELSNENVLVVERIPGQTFDELLQENKLSWDTMMDFFRIHGFYLFGPGIFHGDIHPGNIILTPDNQIALIDTSAVSRIGDTIRQGLFNFFVALADYDYPACARRLNEMAKTRISGRQLETFEADMVELYRDFKGSSVKQVSLTKRMMQTIKMAVHAGMEFERGMFAIIKSMMYLDGMALRCRPDVELMREMKPFLMEFQKGVNQ
ncbi:MAG: AarF/UbiB family protein [Lentisphaeria bacterium]|nr:AarF/UbiB family protein [Lentisphaeria bacterium]